MASSGSSPQIGSQHGSQDHIGRFDVDYDALKVALHRTANARRQGRRRFGRSAGQERPSISGACAGGIWKTIDGGIYWRCVSDGFMGSAAVGAIAVAPSDSNVIYAGTGETAIRLDVSYGDGVYKSTDAGRSWKHIGPRRLTANSSAASASIRRTPISSMLQVLGDVFGPNTERGVYRSKNGGKDWERILFRSDVSGAVDLSMDPNNPRIPVRE